jgi:hypothetical protein
MAINHKILWGTQKVGRGGEVTVSLDGQHAGSPTYWTDWGDAFLGRVCDPMPGVEYHGVMSPRTWGWSQVELYRGGVIKAVVDPERAVSFAAHMNAHVERTNRDCEAVQDERRRALEAHRAQQERNAARDEELRRRLAEATAEA